MTSPTNADVLNSVDKVAELNKLRGALSIPRVDTTGGTSSAPTVVTMGMVFCDFADLTGGDIDSLKTSILGPTIDGTSSVDAAIRSESGGHVKIATTVYAAPTPPSTDSWVTLPGKTSDYLPTGSAFLNERFLKDVDALIAFPDDWDVALFAFPATPTVATGGSLATMTSWCTYDGNIVDRSDNDGKGQTIYSVYISPRDGYTATSHRATTHELLHALGLLDLYSVPAGRSFGWSLMSDCRTGTHITGLEKLLLGWDSLDLYTFVRGGTCTAALVQQSATSGTKGVVILPDPDAGRSDYHYLEIPQDIGRGDANRTEFTTAAANPGILVLAVRTDGQYGRIAPVVAHTPADPEAASIKYGGASQAPFKNGETLQTRGLKVTVTSAFDSQHSTVSCRIEVDRTFRPGSTTTALRDNETITSGGKSFTLTPTGCPSFGSRGVVDQNQVPVVFGLAGTDYGHRLYVSDTGEVMFAKSVEISPPDAAVLRRFSPRTSQPKGDYYLAVEKTSSGEGCLSVFRKSAEAGTADVKIFTPLQEPANMLERGWSETAAGVAAAFDTMGNVKVTSGIVFHSGSLQFYGATPQTIVFSQTGDMYWMDADGAVIRTFRGSTGRGPFTLAAQQPEAGRWNLNVVDTDKKVVSTVFGRIDRGWTNTSGALTTSVSDTGNLVVKRGADQLATAATAFNGTIAAAASLMFENDGTVAWIDSTYNRLHAFGGADGTGPFTLAAVDDSDGRWSVVVRDGGGRTLYSILGYRIERYWHSDDGTYKIVFGDDGNLGVFKNGTFLTGSYQMYDQARPRSITFAADGTMSWLDDNATPIRTFTGTKGTGPFRVAVDPGVDGQWSLVVKDVTGKTLYPVFATTLQRGWTNDDGTATIFFGNDGNLQVRRPLGTFVTGSYQLYEQARPQTIIFANDGTMSWRDADNSILRTFSGTPGVGPFTLTVDRNSTKQWDLVVRDSKGTTLARLFTALERGWESTMFGPYRIFFGDDGNLQVRKNGGYQIGSYQIYEQERRRPQTILFADNGKMFWAEEPNADVEFAGRSGAGPFGLALSNVEDKRWDLVVRDSNGADLAFVFGCLARGWSGPTDANGYQVAFTSTGHLQLSRNGTEMASGDTDAIVGAADYLSFECTGKLSWHKGNKIISSAEGDAGGIGPFTLGVDPIGPVVKDGTTIEGWAIVTKDSAGHSLYAVASHTWPIASS